MAEFKRGASFEEILNYIIRYKQEKGYAPVLREIAEELGCAPATVYVKLKMMNPPGLINYREDCPRTITVPGYHYVREKERREAHGNDGKHGAGSS